MRRTRLKYADLLSPGNFPDHIGGKSVSTGTKMLIILGVALLPLGLIAIFASRESAHVNHIRHQAEASASANAGSIVITEAMRKDVLQLRRAVEDIAPDDLTPVDPKFCVDRLHATGLEKDRASGMAIYNARERLVCATPGYSRTAVNYPADSAGFEARLSNRLGLVRSSVLGPRGRYFGVVEFPAARIAPLVNTPDRAGFGIALHQGSQTVLLSSSYSNNPLDQIISVSAPAAAGQLSLEMRMPASPISALEILLILLPILMWLGGGLIGWLVIDRLLLRPLAQVQHAVAVYIAGKGQLQIPLLKTPAHEIRDLGNSFATATARLTQHEGELAEGLAGQKRLTREVHHRVKNNLQVVSSLISLHARGAESAEVAEAYASIQRRVDALAVVHRNHYAELEENHGVSLRALISEIAGNLRASASAQSGQVTITLNLLSASASQDVAVPVAFLITEMVELVMFCGANTNVAISLSAIHDKPNRALLAIAAPALATQPCLAGPNVGRFQRIAEGLSRQLRGRLDVDTTLGSYTIEIPILE